MNIKNRVSPSIAKSARLLTISLLALPLVAACSSPGNHPAPHASKTSKDWLSYQLVMTECLIDKHIIPETDIRNQSWFKNGKIVPDVNFEQWLLDHDNVKYGGKELQDWPEDAFRKWPTSLCGPYVPPTSTPWLSTPSPG